MEACGITDLDELARRCMTARQLLGAFMGDTAATHLICPNLCSSTLSGLRRG
jgi:hypothetical protein